jgi:hypothetical protein
VKNRRGYCRTVGPLLLVSMSVACERSSLPEIRLATAVRDECPTPTSGDYFFPSGGLHSAGREPGGKNAEIVSAYLRAAGVPSLSCGLGVQEAYRFVRLGERLPALSISVARADSSWEVTTVEFAAPLPRRPSYNVAKRVVRAVPDSEVGPLMKAIATAEFWTTSAGPGEEGEGRIVVVEGRLDRSYRVVTRAAGEDLNARDMTPVAQAFVRLARARIPAPVPFQ